jgi:hypothetical protein
MPLTSWTYVLFHGSGVKLQWLSLVLYITMAVHVQSRGADWYNTRGLDYYTTVPWLFVTMALVFKISWLRLVQCHGFVCALT